MDQQSLLDNALEKGLISDEQRQQLANLAREESGDSQERIKPVGTFNEIFVTFGVIMILSAVQGLGALFLPASSFYHSVLGGLLAWCAALYFHEGKRFRLPVVYGALSAAFNLGYAVAYGLVERPDKLFSPDYALSVSLTPLLIGLAVLAAGAWRFRIPFLMLPIGILFTIIITYAARESDNDISYKLLLGGSGLAILAVAVNFDLKDPTRTKRWSDYAFWSYVVGSPLFVHSLFLSLIITDAQEFNITGLEWILMAILAVSVSFAGLLLNRRALILSTLIYVGVLIFRLLVGITLDLSAGALLCTVLIIGLYVVALGSRWVRVRRHVMQRLPQHWPILKRLPVY